MAAPAIFNRAAQGESPPSSDGPWAAVEKLFVRVMARLTALERREPPKAVKGDDGRGIAAARLNTAGELIFTLSDGSEMNVGLVRPELPEPIAPLVQTVERVVEGAPGIGIAAAALNAAGELCLTLSDGRVLNVGMVKAKDGEPGKDAEPVERPADGVGIANAVQNEAGELLIALSDGRTLNVGRVRAKDGSPGKDADPAAPGTSVRAAVVNEAGQLILSMTDGTDINAGVVVKKGDPGESVKGDPGDNGVGIAKSEIVAGNLVLHMTDGSKQNVGRVVGKDGETKVVTTPSTAPVPDIEIGDTFRANVTAKDLDRLMLREITVDGHTIQVLTLN